MGEKMECETVLPRNEIGGKITKHCSYQTLSLYFVEV